MINKPVFKATAVNKIYVGGDRICRCGCAGNYYYPGDANFDVNLKKFERLWSKYEPNEIDVDGDYLNITTAKPKARTKYGYQIGRAHV